MEVFQLDEGVLRQLMARSLICLGEGYNHQCPTCQQSSNQWTQRAIPGHWLRGNDLLEEENRAATLDSVGNVDIQR